jgi:hypothetical protein
LPHFGPNSNNRDPIYDAEQAWETFLLASLLTKHRSCQEWPREKVRRHLKPSTFGAAGESSPVGIRFRKSTLPWKGAGEMGGQASPHRPRTQHSHFADLAYESPPATCRLKEKLIIADARKTVKI